MGYYLAGFDVIGADTKPQKQYPFPLLRREALSLLRDDLLLEEFDAIHASPPCQSESLLRHVTRKSYTDLLTPTLALLDDLIDFPWVVENVETTVKMPGSVTLCGTHFGLAASGRVLRRHRRFSSSVTLPDPGRCFCRGQPSGGVYGNLSGSPMLRGYKFNPDEARLAMGIDWMSRHGLAQAIPPDYTRWVGEHLMRRFWPEFTTRDNQHDRYSSGRIERFARL